MGGPAVSIIVPVYNVKDYLHRCLDSLLSQTLEDLEIIAVDDGSSDGSSGILDSYAGKDSRVKVIHVVNGGVSRARNIGLEKACGEYIGFVDSDDYVEPGMFGYLHETAVREASDCVQCAFDIVGDEPAQANAGSGRVGIIEGPDNAIRAYFEGRIDVSVCNKLYRRPALAGCRFSEDLGFAEDFRFNSIFMLGCGKMVVLDTVLYHYYMRDSSASHEGISDRHLRGFAVYPEVKVQLKNEETVRLVSEKEVSEALRFLDSSIGHEEVSEDGLKMLITVIRDGRAFIRGNRFMDRASRIRASSVCLMPHLYVALVRTAKRLR